MERAQNQGQGNELERGQETQAQIEATPPVMEDVTWCRVTDFDDEAIAIPCPPSSLCLLEYRCSFDGLRMAETLAQRRNELWRMVQEQRQQREQREFDESMLRLKLEQETERAMEVARLAPRLKSQ